MEIINGNYREKRLDNGLVVALQNTPTKTISAKLRVNQGTYHEKPGEEGMAHFLEHCAVTGGSKKYSPKIADEIRGSFGNSNAFTGLNGTYFVGELLSEDMGKWLDYISDHSFNPRFDLERVNGEKQRVLREISESKSKPHMEQRKKFDEIFYGKHPKSLEILGNGEVIENVGIEKIANFHSRGFSPNNMELILVGGLPENAMEEVEKYFGNYKPGKNTRKEFPKLKHLEGKHKIHFSAPEVINRSNPNESAADLSIMYNAPNGMDEEVYPFTVLNYILGGDTKSHLFQELGLKKGLAYSAFTSHDGMYNAGEGHINAKIPSSRIQEAIGSMFEINERLKKQKIGEKEIERLKKIIKYNSLKGLETNQGHIGAIEAKLDLGLTPEESLRKWNEVTPESIIESANKYLPSEDGNYVLWIKDPLKK